MNSPDNGNGSQPPPAPPLTSRNDPPFLRRSQRQTRSKYRSHSPATQLQQPPTSANIDNQPPTIEPPSPSNQTKSLLPSSPQRSQATQDQSGDAQPAVTALMHPQNQPVPHGHLCQDSVQGTTTSQPQSPPTQTIPTCQKTPCKSQTST